MAKVPTEAHVVDFPEHLGNPISVYQYINFLAQHRGKQVKAIRRKDGERDLFNYEHLSQRENIILFFGVR